MIFCHHSNWFPDKYKSLTKGEPTSICQSLWSGTRTISGQVSSQVSDENHPSFDIICLHIKIYLQKLFVNPERNHTECLAAGSLYLFQHCSTEVPANKTERWVVQLLPPANTNFIVVIHAVLFLDFGIFIDLFLSYCFYKFLFLCLPAYL